MPRVSLTLRKDNSNNLGLAKNKIKNSFPIQAIFHQNVGLQRHFVNSLPIRWRRKRERILSKAIIRKFKIHTRKCIKMICIFIWNVFRLREIMCYLGCSRRSGKRKTADPGRVWNSTRGWWHNQQACSFICSGLAYRGMCLKTTPSIGWVESEYSFNIHAKPGGIFMKICPNFSKYRRHSSKKRHQFNFYRFLKANANQISEL